MENTSTFGVLLGK